MKEHGNRLVVGEPMNARHLVLRASPSWSLLTTRGTQDMANGKGTMLYTNGDRYTGDFLNGKKHGEGELVYNSGACFRGEWLNDQACGRGVFHHANGSSYEGEWLLSKRHGFGIFRCKQTGLVYEGEYAEGRRHGAGTIRFPDGGRMTGAFERGRLVGTVEYAFDERSPWADPSY